MHLGCVTLELQKGDNNTVHIKYVCPGPETEQWCTRGYVRVQVQKADNSALAKDVAKEIKQLGSKLLKTKDRREKGDIRRELKRLGKEERQRQQQAVEDVIKDANVVLTTLAGALSRQIQVQP